MKLAFAAVYGPDERCPELMFQSPEELAEIEKFTARSINIIVPELAGEYTPVNGEYYVCDMCEDVHRELVALDIDACAMYCPSCADITSQSGPVPIH